CRTNGVRGRRVVRASGRRVRCLREARRPRRPREPRQADVHPPGAASLLLEELRVLVQEQLGAEGDFPQKALPGGKTAVDAFLFVFDVSVAAPQRASERSLAVAHAVLTQVMPSFLFLEASKCFEY